MMFQQNDAGGGDLGGHFPGQTTPANCAYRAMLGNWILEPVSGSTPGVFYIRNQATGDHLQFDVPGTAIGNHLNLVNPRGKVQEQWQLIP
jgi:hypothetical protein